MLVENGPYCGEESLAAFGLGTLIPLYSYASVAPYLLNFSQPQYGHLWGAYVLINSTSPVLDGSP